MNAHEQMPNAPAQSPQQEENNQQVLHQEAQKKDPDGTAASTGHGTSRSGMVLPDLEKALDALDERPALVPTKKTGVAVLAALEARPYPDIDLTPPSVRLTNMRPGVEL